MDDPARHAITIEDWQPALVDPPPAPERSIGWRPAHTLLGLLVFAVHALLIAFGPPGGSRGAGGIRGAVDQTAPLVVAFVESFTSQRAFEIPQPVLRKNVGEIEVKPLAEVGDEPSDPPPPSSETRPVVAFAAPRLAPDADTNTSPYAERAGLTGGRAVIVVMALTISEGGMVTDAAVERSCGDARVDAIAAEYARTLKWIPATVNGRPSAMRIRFPATLRSLI